MLKASFILGLISGIFGIITGACGGFAGMCGAAVCSVFKESDTGGVDAAFYTGIVLIILSIAGIVGAGLVQKEKIVGTILQASYPVVGFISIMVIGLVFGNVKGLLDLALYIFALPALLFAIATILGFLGKAKKEQ